MNKNASQFLSMLKTIIFLIVIEIVSSSLLPTFGLSSLRIVITILFTLFLALRIESNLIAFYILIIHLFHSAFSIEGWAIGTFCGLVLSLVLGFIRGNIQVNSYPSTVILTFVFHMCWLFISTTLICLKLQNFESFISLYFQPVLGIIAISIFSPFFFSILESFWKKNLRNSDVRF